MGRVILALCLMIGLALPVSANEFAPVTDRGKFISLVDGRELRLGRFGVKLRVAADGTIRGVAIGDEITGTWSWDGGYFCREMDWSGYAIDYNCQLVEVAGVDRLRFTVDRGAGRSAEFTLQ